jgi:hypothetical protein
MIAVHRLHDGQPEPRAVLLGCAVRREEALAFLRRETSVCVEMWFMRIGENAPCVGVDSSCQAGDARSGSQSNGCAPPFLG